MGAQHKSSKNKPDNFKVASKQAPSKVKSHIAGAKKKSVHAPVKKENLKKIIPVIAAKTKIDAKVKAKTAPLLIKNATKLTKAKDSEVKTAKEVVLEVPAARGVAILKDGKKKAKSESSSQALAKKRCREPGCDHDGALNMYCRLHYIINWRKIKRKEAILASGQLNNYVEELVNKYPEKYLEVIRQDLASEKDWSKVVIDLELESQDDEIVGDDDADAPMHDSGGSKRDRADFEDDGDAF